MIKNLRLINCEFPGCAETLLEAQEGAGWPGWGHIAGLAVNGAERDLHLCPLHLERVTAFILSHRQGET